MGLEALTVGQRRDNWAELLETCWRNLLRCDVFLERQSVDATELASVAICRQSVVGARGIIPTTMISMSIYVREDFESR